MPTSTDSNNAEDRSMTIEDYEGKYLPLLNTALDLMNTHQDIPEEVDQSDIISALITMKKELGATLHNRVPEFVKLQEDMARKDKQIRKLQETNQQLYLKVGNTPEPGKNPDEPDKPPKKSWEEIKAMIDKI